MKRIVLLFSILPLLSFSQDNDTVLIKQTIGQLFEGMRTGDSSKVRAVMHKDAFLHSAVKTKTGESRLINESVAEFVKMVGAPHKEEYNEIIWSYDIKIDGIMATVWAPYTFYLGETLSHCGVDDFTLMKTAKGWVILSITDTRRKDNCKAK